MCICMCLFACACVCSVCVLYMCALCVLCVCMHVCPVCVLCMCACVCARMHVCAVYVCVHVCAQAHMCREERFTMAIICHFPYHLFLRLCLSEVVHLLTGAEVSPAQCGAGTTRSSKWPPNSSIPSFIQNFRAFKYIQFQIFP